jgi:pimeloyl-ACP methyl ester carboxylesterase
MPLLESQGVQIYFDDVGAGEPIVLGHSFLCSGEMWAPQVERLAGRFRLINVDLRGHGRSGQADEPFTLYDVVQDTVAVLDHLGIERAVWAGLSIGGMVALRAALVVPERVSALILLDTDAGAEVAYKRLKYGVMALGTRLLGIRPFLSPIVRLMFGRSTRRANQILVNEWKARFAGVHLPSILNCLTALMQRDSVVHRLEEIQVPSLVLVGEEDASLPLALSQRIAAGLRDSRLVQVPTAGHLTALEQPEAVTAAMAGFLEETSRLASAEP